MGSTQHYSGVRRLDGSSAGYHEDNVPSKTSLNDEPRCERGDLTMVAGYPDVRNAIDWPQNYNRTSNKIGGDL